MARMVRAVSDGEAKYVGYDGRKRYVNGEEFEWKRPGPLPLVQRNDEGVIVSGWVEMVSGDPNEGVEEWKKAQQQAPKKKKDPARRGLTPAMVETNATTTMPKEAGVGSGRASDRIIG
jgi:hypothetical protein